MYLYRYLVQGGMPHPPMDSSPSVCATYALLPPPIRPQKSEIGNMKQAAHSHTNYRLAHIMTIHVTAVLILSLCYQRAAVPAACYCKGSFVFISLGTNH